MTYLSPHVRAEKLRHAIRMARSAKEMLKADFGEVAEKCLEFINDDLDNAIRKASAALEGFDALLEEQEQD